MFDRLTIVNPHRGPEHVTVHEHRAPTDQSIQLYSDMLEKARKQIAHEYSGTLRIGEIDSKVVSFLEALTGNLMVYVKCLGMEERFSIDTMLKDERQIKLDIFTKISNMITAKILNDNDKFGRLHKGL